MPAMAAKEALIIREAGDDWQLAQERLEAPPMLGIDMGNPMIVGPISRQHWMTCSAEDTWEQLMAEVDEDSDSDKSPTEWQSESYEWDFVDNGGGAAKGLSALEHFH